MAANAPRNTEAQRLIATYTSDQQVLSLSNLNLTTLPPIPEGVITLDINNNKLTELPKLPSTLRTLYCRDNELESLPELPNSLINLYCHKNYLEELPTLPTTLKALWCGDNNIRRLPKLPALRQLNIENNPFDEPFLNYAEEYEATGNLPLFIFDVNHALRLELLANVMKERGRNLKTAKLVLGKKMNADTLGIVGSYLSGSTNRTSNINTQRKRVQEIATRPIGGPGVSGGRKTRRASAKRVSTRRNR